MKEHDIYNRFLEAGFGDKDARYSVDVYKQLWSYSASNASPIPSTEKPNIYVLGGQPGAGKSDLIEKTKKELSNNLIVINADEYRKLHPKYHEIQKEYGDDASSITGKFTAILANAIKEKAILERYNIVIEGTFRQDNVPISTIEQCKANNYMAHVLIKTCPQKESWESCLSRYNNMKEMKEKFPNTAPYPRYVKKEFHDLVVSTLSTNVKSVFEKSKADTFQVFSREGQIFNSLIDDSNDLFSRVDKEINREPGTLNISFSYENGDQNKLTMRINSVDSKDYISSHPDVMDILQKNKLLSQYSDELASGRIEEKFSNGLLRDMVIDSNGEEILKQKGLEKEDDFIM